MALSTSQQLIDSKMWEVESVTRRLRALRLNKRALTTTLAYMERTIARFKGYESVHCWTEDNAWETVVSLHVVMEAKVTSLKEGIVVDLLKFMMEASFETEATSDSVGSSYASRTYNFTRKATDTTLKIEFKFHADVSENGEDASCKRVQVGVETKEVPKYAIKCD